jgi:hypothetical protein
VGFLVDLATYKQAKEHVWLLVAASVKLPVVFDFIRCIILRMDFTDVHDAVLVMARGFAIFEVNGSMAE